MFSLAFQAKSHRYFRNSTLGHRKTDPSPNGDRCCSQEGNRSCSALCGATSAAAAAKCCCWGLCCERPDNLFGSLCRLESVDCVLASVLSYDVSGTTKHTVTCAIFVANVWPFENRHNNIIFTFFMLSICFWLSSSRPDCCNCSSSPQPRCQEAALSPVDRQHICLSMP